MVSCQINSADPNNLRDKIWELWGIGEHKHHRLGKEYKVFEIRFKFISRAKTEALQIKIEYKDILLYLS